MTGEAAHGEEIVIATRGLSRRFGRRLAVDGVDLAVRRGEIFGCLGPNGSGKSTLMRMLLGLLSPSSGEARVLDHDIPRDADHLRPHVGYMTQRFSLYEDLSVRENLEFAAEVFGVPGRRRRVEASIHDYGLESYAAARAATLSGGWKQRLALAVATVHQPELLILDEPTAGVDPQNRREFWERLFDLSAAGTTVFVSTHYMDEAVRCHRLCLLREGRRGALGTPAALVASLADRVVDVRVDDPERAVAVLSRARQVASTTQLGDTVHALLRREAAPSRQAAPGLERELCDAGLGQVSVTPAVANLEDVFVALLRGETLGGANA